MKLDLSSLHKAIDSLEESCKISQNNEFINSLSSSQKNLITAGVIQHFEFTYGLCWKFMQRWIRINQSPEDAEPRTRKDLFRQMARLGMINEPQKWFTFTEARNLTSHTYNLDVADQVYQHALLFAKEAKQFAKMLDQHND